MRKIFLPALSLLLLSACAQGYISETASHPAMAPSDLPKITALHITENAKGDAKLCKSFHLTQAQALAYFNTARIVSETDAKAVSCYAQGNMTFAFEGPAIWAISKGGYATLTRKNGTKLNLFCPDCILGNVN